MKQMDAALQLEQVINALREKRELLELDMQNITAELHTGKLMNTLLYEDVRRIFDDVEKLQAEILNLAQGLSLVDDAESGLDQIDSKLHALMNVLAEKAALEPLVDFVRNLHSKDGEVQRILQGLRQEVEAIDFETLSVEELKVALHKYALLKEAFDVKDPFHRFQKVMNGELNELFDLRLLYQLTQMKDLYLANNPLHMDGVQEELDFEEKKTEFLSEPETPEEEVAALASVAEALVEESVVSDEATVTEEQVGATEEEAAAEEAVEESVVTDEATVTDVVVENAAVTEEAVEASVEEPAVSDEAVVAEEALEATVADAVVHEKAVEAPVEVPNSYAAALYLGSNDPIYDASDWNKQKRFSANSFKREVPDAMSALIFQFIGEYFFFSFKSIKAVWGQDVYSRKYIVDRFVRAGYLKQCSLGEGQEFYALTKYGFNIYQAQSLKNFLHMRDLGMSGFEKQYGKVRKYTAWAYLDTLNIWSKLEKAYHILNTQSVVNAESFIYSTDIADGNKGWKIAGVGIFTDDISKFTNVLTYLNQHTYDIIVVSGQTAEQAKAVISWLRDHLEASTRARSFMYKLVNEEQLYTLDERPVEILELANHVCVKPNCPCTLGE